MTEPPNIRWRIHAIGWVAIPLALAAEAVSNGLRAYGLGEHLERFTVTFQGTTVSLAGAVLVMAAAAISLAQSRAGWLSFAPGVPMRQRLIALPALALCLVVSAAAMVSHILDADRAKGSDEGTARAAYDRAQTAYTTADAELKTLGNPRPVAVIQAEVATAVTDWAAWRRSKQCEDITKDNTAEACKPVLKLYEERGRAARKTTLEAELAKLRAALDGMQRPEAKTESAAAVGDWWAWLLGSGVVLVATFGPVLFAVPVPVKGAAVTPNVITALPPVDAEEPPITEPLPPPTGGSYTKERAEHDIVTLLAMGFNPFEKQAALKDRWQVAEGTVSKWIGDWERKGTIPKRVQVGRVKMLKAPERVLEAT
jgi:hypothetical protein